ncbi:FAD-dependent monooxygenase [Rickettsiales endosymbiont of Trichoplax sp. H2]|uniref:FAD-dependent monooxygenase n=1 Tax=Rickettsiales endosymbiont of Trichoplax sp. H2 TaxID=2021221 RepID=UPI0012B22A06|nr:FAD-dependent monooxygenase [Rickettsiales endosymbiont of Trichoplax sp. H2]MSO14247.1 Pentachlorophenol 4-monooxygenase [Rickettsiales endosymbiont of Trichoplax sp. H2]
MKNRANVLVVGAGPVGLLTAALLTHYGVSMRIIDKRSDPTKTSNAVAVHARTLELFNTLDLSEKFINTGRLIKSMELYSCLKHFASIDFKFIGSQYDFVCCIPQSQTERLLIEYLANRGIQVEREVEVINIEKDVAQSVTVVTNKETIVADWVVACDGYHSVIRQVLDIPYEGKDLELKFIMIDSPIDWQYSLDSMYTGLNEQLSVMLFPMQNSVRIMAEVSHSIEFNNAEPNEDIFMQIFKRCLPGDIKIHKPLWSSKFWIHERLATNYVKGRVLLAGDAAHVHSPAGGQGMNTGMQDAFNLSWKLALIINGGAGETLLQSYQQERRPVAQKVLASTTHMTKSVLSKNKILNKIRNILMSLITKPSIIQRKITSFISETAINYETSSIVLGHSINGLKPGDRLPCFVKNNVKHLIIDFSGNAKSVLNDDKFITVINASEVNLPSELNNIKEGYCVLRPDFYIGYLGNDLLEVQQYIKKVASLSYNNGNKD